MGSHQNPSAHTAHTTHRAHRAPRAPPCAREAAPRGARHAQSKGRGAPLARGVQARRRGHADRLCRSRVSRVSDLCQEHGDPLRAGDAGIVAPIECTGSERVALSDRRDTAPPEGHLDADPLRVQPPWVRRSCRPTLGIGGRLSVVGATWRAGSTCAARSIKERAALLAIGPLSLRALPSHAALTGSLTWAYSRATCVRPC